MDNLKLINIDFMEELNVQIKIISLDMWDQISRCCSLLPTVMLENREEVRTWGDKPFLVRDLRSKIGSETHIASELIIRWSKTLPLKTNLFCMDSRFGKDRHKRKHESQRGY